MPPSSCERVDAVVRESWPSSIGTGMDDAADALAGWAARAAGADHALRLGGAAPTQQFVPLPGGGPRLVWRGVADLGMPPLPNWALQLRDIELF